MSLYTDENKNWFDKKNAFQYLEVDQDNIERINIVVTYLKKKINNTKKNKGVMKLLDVGCGDGQIGKKFYDLGYYVYGIDNSPRNLIFADKNNIRTKLGDVSIKLPYSNNYFDVIFAGEIIEHVFDTRKFLMELNRIMNKKGLLIITTPNLAHFPDRIRLLLGKTPTQIQPIHPFLHLHIRPFTYDTLADCLKNGGFKILNFVSTPVVFKRDVVDFNKVTISSKLLAKIFPRMGSTLIVFCNKS